MIWNETEAKTKPKKYKTLIFMIEFKNARSLSYASVVQSGRPERWTCPVT